MLRCVVAAWADLVVERPAGRLAVEHEYARRSHQPLTSVMIGRHWRFYGRDVEAWLTYLR